MSPKSVVSYLNSPQLRLQLSKPRQVLILEVKCKVCWFIPMWMQLTNNIEQSFRLGLAVFILSLTRVLPAIFTVHAFDEQWEDVIMEVDQLVLVARGNFVAIFEPVAETFDMKLRKTMIWQFSKGNNKGKKDQGKQNQIDKNWEVKCRRHVNDESCSPNENVLEWLAFSGGKYY